MTLDVVWVSTTPEFSQAVSDLEHRGAKLLITAGSSASAAAKRHTSIIPIVFVSVGNPIGIGLVESLSRPGLNATGFSDVLADLSSKYVQFATQLGNPQSAVHYLWHTEWPDGENRLHATERAAKSSGVELQSRGFGDIGEVNDVLVAMKKGGAPTLIVQPSPQTPDGVRRGVGRIVSTGGGVRRSHSQGRQASRASGASANEIRAGHKPQSCEGPRSHRAFAAARAFRPAHRMRDKCPLLAQSGHELLHCTCPLLGAKRTCLFAPQMSAYDPERRFVRVRWCIAKGLFDHLVGGHLQ